MRKIRTRKRVRAKAGDGAPAGQCPLCDRPMLTGPSLDEHHPVPRSHGGRETVTMHKVCHRAIHAMLSEAELAEEYSAFTALRTHPLVQEPTIQVSFVDSAPPSRVGSARFNKAVKE